MTEPGQARSRFRLTIAGMMGLVAIAAIVLFFFDRAERRKRAKINRAIAVLREFRPDVDLSRFDPTLGKASTDAHFQQVEFQSKEDPQKRIGVVIPIQDETPRP